MIAIFSNINSWKAFTSLTFYHKHWHFNYSTSIRLSSYNISKVAIILRYTLPYTLPQYLIYCAKRAPPAKYPGLNSFSCQNYNQPTQLAGIPFHKGFYICMSTTAVFLMLGCCLLLSLAFRFSFTRFVVRFLLDILPLVFAAAPTILNIFPPHAVHIPEMPLRPSFILTRFSSLISRLTLHFIQYPSVVNLPYFSCLDIRLARFDACNISCLDITESTAGLVPSMLLLIQAFVKTNCFAIIDRVTQHS